MSRAHFVQGSTSIASASLSEGEYESSSTSRSEVTLKPRGPHAFTPKHLFDMLGWDRAGGWHIDFTIVNSAWYGKQTTSVRHEFILIQIGDYEIAGRTKYLVLDRTVGDASQANIERTTSFFTLCVGTDALDSFWILDDDPGDREQLLRGCGLDSHIFLEQIDFQPDEPLFLFDLVRLVLQVSSTHPKYHPLVANCYWFAGLIWECMHKMRPTARHEVLDQSKRGKITFMHLLPDFAQAGNVLKEAKNYYYPS